MRSIERLEQNKRLKDANRRPPPPDEEMEEELEHKPFMPFNTAASIFDEGLGKRFGGINTAPSIFDRGAVFHTGKQK